MLLIDVLFGVFLLLSLSFFIKWLKVVFFFSERMKLVIYYFFFVIRNVYAESLCEYYDTKSQCTPEENRGKLISSFLEEGKIKDGTYIYLKLKNSSNSWALNG